MTPRDEIARFADLMRSPEQSYAARRTAADAQVVRWRWTSTSDWWLEPFLAERANAAARRAGRAPLFRKARVLREAPSAPAYGTMQYGYDVAGRVVVERMYVHATTFTETFYAWGDTVEQVGFESPERPSRYASGDLDAQGRVVELRQASASTTFVKRFIWRDDRLVGTESRHGDAEGTLYAPQIETEAQLAEALAAVVDTIGAPRELLARIEPMVVEAVVSAFERVALDGPAYCLILSYAGPGNALFPPLVGIGLERDRRELLERKRAGELAAELHEVLWDPSDWEHYLPIELPDAALVRETNRACSQDGTSKLASAAFERIAGGLRARAWAPVTEDFVVCAIDFDASNQAAALKKAAGAKRWTEWKKAGWVA